MTKAALGRAITVLAVLLGSMVLAVPASGQSDRSATVRLRGTTGTERVTIYAQDDVMLWDRVVSTSWADVSIVMPPTTTSIRVTFTNDGRTDDGSDRNVLVDSVTWDDGTVQQAEDMLSRGVWNGIDCGEGYRNSEFLACNGWFEFPVPSAGPSTPPSGTISFAARGWTGSEIAELEVDGEVIRSFTVSTALEVYQASVDGPVNQVRVNFVNDGRTPDGADRNLLVEYLEAAGGRYDPIDALSQGVWNGTDCGVGYRQSRLLACNGWFEFTFEDVGGGDGDGGDGGGGEPSGNNGYVAVTLRGTTGTETAVVSVNGVELGRISAMSVFAEIGMPLPGGPIESVRVAFINDGRDGQGRDRNLIVQSIELPDRTYTPDDFYGRGVWDGTSCTQEAYHSSNYLACNGWFEIYPDGDGGGVELVAIRSYGCIIQTGPEVDGVTDQVLRYYWGSDLSTGEVDYVANTRLEGPETDGFAYSLGPDATYVVIVTDPDTAERVDTLDIIGPNGERVTSELVGGCPDDRSFSGEVTAWAADSTAGNAVELRWRTAGVDETAYDIATVYDSTGAVVYQGRSTPFDDPRRGLAGGVDVSGLATGEGYVLVVETCLAFLGPDCGGNLVIVHDPYEFFLLDGAPGTGDGNRAAPVDVVGQHVDLTFPLTWTDPDGGPNPDTYEIVIEAEDRQGSAVGWWTVDGSATSAVVQVWPAQGRYRFAVRSCTASGCSAWSSWSDWVTMPEFA